MRKRFCAILLLAVCVPLGAQTGLQRDSLLQAARSLKQQYRFDAAAETLSSILSPGQMDAEVLGELADCHFQSGNSEDASALYGILMQLVPEHNGFRMRYMTLAYRAKAYEDVIETGRELLQRDSLLQALTLVGDAFGQMNELDSALAYYQAALRRQPEKPTLVVKAADVLLRQKEYREALNLTTAFLEVDPSYVPVRQLQGMTHFLLEHYAQSANVFQALVDDGDDSYATHYYLGHSYRETKRPYLAIPEFQAAWQKDSSSVALALDIGTEAAKFHRDWETDVLPWFDRAQNLLKESESQLYYVHKDRGDAYFEMAEWRKAASEYRSAQVYKPSFINTYPRLAFCLERLGDKKSALQWYQRFLDAAKPGDQWYDYATQAVTDLKAKLFMEE